MRRPSHGVPVTLKMRTGWDRAQRNAATVARIAYKQRGIRVLAVHGRTREQGYKGEAEYDTIAAVKAAVRFRWSPTATSTRRKARARAAPDRRRRDHDRPRRAGPALDLPRDRPLPAHRRRSCPPTLAEIGERWWRTCTTTTRCTANSPACASRASTSAGTRGPCRGAAFRTRMNAIEDQRGAGRGRRIDTSRPPGGDRMPAASGCACDVEELGRDA